MKDKSQEDSSASQKQWVQDTNLLSQIYQFAREFLKEAGDNHVLALGQSPAWVVTAAKIIDPQLNYQHVAMSGNIMIAQGQIKNGTTHFYFRILLRITHLYCSQNMNRVLEDI